MKQINVNYFIKLWYLTFLIQQIQQVRVNNTLIDPKLIKREPHRGVSPSHSSSRFAQMIVFSLETYILSLLLMDSSPLDFPSKAEVERFVQWCNDNHLVLNV